MTANSNLDISYKKKGKCFQFSKMPKYLSKLSTTHNDQNKSEPNSQKEGHVNDNNYCSNKHSTNASTCAKTRNVTNSTTVRCLAYSSFL